MFSSEDNIIFEYLNVKDELFLALDIVKNYIIENNLILTGGFALDLSLKNKGSFIYDNYTIPDYDVLSNNHEEHCNKLGLILCNLKYDVDIIPAIHNTTMRIKTLGFTIFDCTYIPTSIINKIPTLNYDNFILVHPHYQMIDQYISMTYLFNLTGADYNYASRLKKDYERNELIQQFYPEKLLKFNNLYAEFDIKNKKKLNDLNNFKTVMIPLAFLYNNPNKSDYNIKIYNEDKYINTINDLRNYKINDNLDKNNIWYLSSLNICCGPLLSFLLLNCINRQEKILDFLKLDIKDEQIIINIHNNFENILMPDIMINKDIELFLDKNNIKATFKNKILDIIPKSYENDIRYYDISSKNMTTDIINYKGYNFMICSPLYILTIFKYKSIIFDDEYNIYSYLYSYMLTNNLSYLTISSFDTNNLNDEQNWYIKNLTSKNDITISKPTRNYLKKESCILKNSTFEIEKSEIFQIS